MRSVTDVQRFAVSPLPRVESEYASVVSLGLPPDVVFAEDFEPIACLGSVNCAAVPLCTMLGAVLDPLWAGQLVIT